MTTGPHDGTASSADDGSIEADSSSLEDNASTDDGITQDGDFEHDPTGMRALLSTLPDPGPMPPDLVSRIRSSLAAEAIERAGRAGLEPAPVLPLPPRSERHLGANIPRRRLAGPPKWLLPVAAAAVVVAGGGAVVTGMLKGGGSLSVGANDLSRETSAAAHGAGDSGGTSTAPAPAAASEMSRSDARLTFVGSGRAFADDGLAAEAARLVEQAARTGGGPAAAPVATDFGAGGVLACLERLGAPGSAPALIESGAFANRPAILVAYATGPQTWTASIVARTCGADGADRLAGPVSITTGTKTS